MANNLDDIRQLIKEARKELMNKANVVATGVGYKTSAGKQTSELALICSVDSKKSVQSLTKKELIPASIQNIPTDVNPTGIIRAQQDPTGRFRPAPGGVSIGHYSITAGTLGCLVKKNNKLYILSNNHVLANSNDAAIGDDIIQPGSYDGGQLPDDKIAELSEFVQIQFAGPGVDPCGVGNAVASFMNVFAKMLGSGTRLQSTRIQAEDNLVDCAIAAPMPRRPPVTMATLPVSSRSTSSLRGVLG